MKTPTDCKSFYEGEVMRPQYVAAVWEEGGGNAGKEDAPCCSSRVMDPSCLCTTDEGESGTQTRPTEHQEDRSCTKVRASPVRNIQSHHQRGGGSPKGQTAVTLMVQHETHDKP